MKHAIPLCLADILCDIGMIDQFVGELNGEHSNYHEHLMSALLSLVRDHQRALSECQREELQLPKFLRERIQFLNGKEEYNVSWLLYLRNALRMGYSNPDVHVGPSVCVCVRVCATL